MPTTRPPVRKAMQIVYHMYIIVYYLHVITCVYNHRYIYMYIYIYVYIYCICNISQDITTRQHDRQTLHVGNPLPAFGGNGRSTAQEYLITPRTWQHGFSWKWDWPKKVPDQDVSISFCIWHIVTINIELDCQQWEVYGGYSIQLYIHLIFGSRLKTMSRNWLVWSITRPTSNWWATLWIKLYGLQRYRRHLLLTPLRKITISNRQIDVSYLNHQ